MAYLHLGEQNTRQIVAILYDLDESYGYEGRIAKWYCYMLASDEDEGSLIEEVVTDIPAEARTASYIFSNLLPDTRYRIKVIVTGIIDFPDRVFVAAQRTAISGGSDYGNIPHIRKFILERDGIGVPKIKCYLRITNLAPGDNYISLAAYKKSDGILASSWTNNVASDNVDEYVLLPANDGEALTFETYTVQLIVQNTGVVPQQAEEEITLVDVPVSLFCTFEDRVVMVNGGRSSVIVYDYPGMSADSWNDFWQIVNTVRIAAGLEEITDDYVLASSGNEMSAIIFGYLYEAINDIYEATSDFFKPSDFENAGNLLEQHKRITPAVISGIENGLYVIYNHYFKREDV